VLLWEEKEEGITAYVNMGKGKKGSSVDVDQKKKAI